MTPIGANPALLKCLVRPGFRRPSPGAECRERPVAANVFPFRRWTPEERARAGRAAREHPWIGSAIIAAIAGYVAFVETGWAHGAAAAVVALLAMRFLYVPAVRSKR